VKTHWTNVTVVSPTAEIASDLLIDGVRIAGIVPSATSSGDDWQAIDGQGAVLFPGMIDLLQHQSGVVYFDLWFDPARDAKAPSRSPIRLQDGALAGAGGTDHKGMRDDFGKDVLEPTKIA